jgi:exopolysaccharide production protein ExoZ
MEASAGKEESGSAATRQGERIAAGGGPQILSFQYLRGLAALSVVLFHASLEAGIPVASGAFGVNLFFVISGFLMVAITGKDSRPGRFIADRIVRIVPLYWLATTAQIALWTVTRSGPVQWEWWAGSYLFLPMHHPLAPEHVVPVVGQGWTLNYEMMFYLAFGLVLFLPRRFQIAALTAFFGALVLAGSVWKTLPTPLEFWTDSIILQFLLGAWLAWAATDEVGKSRLPWLIIAACALHFAFPAKALLVYVLIVAAALLLERAGRVRRWKAAQLLGEASYSIYLWHYLAIWIIEAAVNRLGLPALLVFPLGLIGGTAAGLAAYLLIEAPFLAILRKRKYRRGYPVPGGV